MPVEIFLMLTTLLLSVGTSSFSTFMALVDIGEDIPAWQRPLFMSGLGLARISTLVGVGLVGSFVPSPKTLQVACLLLAAAASAYANARGHFWVAASGRLFEAAGLVVSTLSMRFLINNAIVDSAKRQRLNAFSSSSQSLGFLIGPAMSGFTIAAFGLAQTFAFLAMVFLAAAASAVCVRTPINTTGKEPATLLRANPTRQTWSRSLLLFCAAHSLEFTGLGLWLSSWPRYATLALHWPTNWIGLAASTSATAGFVSPLMFSGAAAVHAVVLAGTGLLLLAVQPILILLQPNHVVVPWLAFAVGGTGAGLYFAFVHQAIKEHLVAEQTVPFYTAFGIVNLVGLATGQMLGSWLTDRQLAPYSLGLDAFLLLLATAVLLWATRTRS